MTDEQLHEMRMKCFDKVLEGRLPSELTEKELDIALKKAKALAEFIQNG